METHLTVGPVSTATRQRIISLKLPESVLNKLQHASNIEFIQDGESARLASNGDVLVDLAPIPLGLKESKENVREVYQVTEGSKRGDAGKMRLMGWVYKRYQPAASSGFLEGNHKRLLVKSTNVSSPKRTVLHPSVSTPKQEDITDDDVISKVRERVRHRLAVRSLPFPDLRKHILGFPETKDMSSQQLTTILNTVAVFDANWTLKPDAFRLVKPRTWSEYETDEERKRAASNVWKAVLAIPDAERPPAEDSLWFELEPFPRPVDKQEMAKKKLEATRAEMLAKKGLMEGGAVATSSPLRSASTPTMGKMGQAKASVTTTATFKKAAAANATSKNAPVASQSVKKRKTAKSAGVDTVMEAKISTWKPAIEDDTRWHIPKITTIQDYDAFRERFQHEATRQNDLRRELSSLEEQAKRLLDRYQANNKSEEVKRELRVVRDMLLGESGVMKRVEYEQLKSWLPKAREAAERAIQEHRWNMDI